MAGLGLQLGELQGLGLRGDGVAMPPLPALSAPAGSHPSRDSWLSVRVSRKEERAPG